MKFSTKEDLEIPISESFDLLSDFESFERAGMRHGAEVVRTDDRKALEAGMKWDVKAPLRGNWWLCPGNGHGCRFSWMSGQRPFRHGFCCNRRSWRAIR